MGGVASFWGRNARAAGQAARGGRHAATRARRRQARAISWLLLIASVPLVGLTSGYDSPAAGSSPVADKTPASADTSFSAGSYIIDMGALTTTKPAGLQTYGILYQLLANVHTPVSWIIKDGKTGGAAAPGTGLPALAAQTTDFSATVIVDGAAKTTSGPVQSKSYVTGAFVVPKEYITTAVDAAINMFPNVVVDKSTTSFTAPVFHRLQYWPKAVLDATNGSIAQGFYTNAGVPNNPKAYVWKYPSQLTSCDDIYVMPHADPTWATHSYLKGFNNQGGYIWAGCHAVSVLENLVNPANSNDRMNFLTTNGLLPYGSHGGGSPPYSYNTDGSDPVMQIGGPIDAAVQNGSEQIYMPKVGSAWRNSTVDVAWDATQADVTASKSPGDARVLTYGRGFGNASNGMVMYEAGHSVNKGTAGDVPAERAFFNFLLLGGIERGPATTISSSVGGQVVSGGTTTLTANISGGSPGYTYQWTGTCSGGSFSTSTGFLSGPGSISTTYTAPTVTTGQSCAVQLLVTDQCGRQPFGSTSFTVVPSADLSLTKSVDQSVVSVNGNLVYTLTAKNNGSGTAASPTVTDTLPAGAQYVSATPAPTSQSGQTLTWSLANMAVNATSTITVTAKALTAGAVLTNTASVTSTSTDPNPDNNTASATSRVLSSGVSIEKVARPQVVGPSGGSVAFEFVVHNTGTDALHNVVVTDNPTCASITGPTGDLNNDNILGATSGGVETEIWRYTCTRTVTTATGDVAQSSGGFSSGVPAVDASTSTKQDVVQVTAKDPLNNTLNAVASTVVTIANPSISVTKTLSPAGQAPASGGKATFAVTVTNTGNVPLVSTSTADIWTGTCNATLPTLAVGASYSMKCDATVPGSTSDGFAALSYSGGSGWTDNWTESGGETDGATAGKDQVVSASGLGLPALGYSAPDVLQLGGNKVLLTRQVNLSGKTSAVLRFSYFRTSGFNGSTRPLTVGVSSDGTTFTNQTIQPQTPNASDTSWSTFEMTIPASALGSATRIRFGDTTNDLTNRLIYVDDVEVVSNQVNSVTASARDVYGTPVTATATAGVTAGTPALTITKSATPTGVRTGDTFNYTVTVANSSATTFQSGIAVTDTLPSGLVQNGTVTVNRPSYWQTKASDDFGTTRLYTTGTGWGGSWTETAGDTNSDPLAGKIQVDSTVGNPASSLFLTPGKVDTRVQRLVDLSGTSAAQIQFQCSRTNPNSIDDVAGLYVNGSLLYVINQNSSTTECPTNGSSFGTVTVPVPTAALVNNAAVEIRGNGDKKFWFDNITIRVAGTATTVSAGDLPNLTSTGGNNGSSTNFGLAPGGSMTFTIPVKVNAAPSDGLEFSNLAQSTSTQQTAPVAATATTPYVDPSFSITKAAIETWVSGSGNVVYRIELRNTGNVALTSVAVTDPSCNAAPAYVSGDLNTDNRLQLGEIWRYQCTRTVSAALSSSSPPDPVVVPNTATATMTDAITGTALASRTASAEVRVIHPLITITPSPATTVISSGATVAYTYTVKNTGDIGLTNVTPTAANCSPLAYQSGDANGDGALGVTETWSYTCTTSAITSNQLSRAVSVSAKDTLFAATVSDSKSVNVYVTPPLVLTKTATDATTHQSGSSISVGAANSITYTYTVNNPSAVPAVGLPLTSVTVTDNKCSPVSPTMSGGFVVGDTNTDNKLDPGETWSYRCTGGTLASTTTNSAFASGAYSAGGGGNVLSNQASATVTVLTPQLILAKESSSETVRPGHSVAFTFHVANTGATSFDLASLGTPSDKVVDANGNITGTTACSPISAASFPHDADHDVNGNGVLNPGDTLTYTCSTVMTADTLDAFGLGASTDTLGTSFTPDPALAQVFVIDPTFTVQKFATTSLGGPATSVRGIPGNPVSYTFDVTHTTAVTGTFHDQLSSLAMTLQDDKCDAQPVYVNGDANGNGLLDPGEVWHYTCSLSALPDGGATVNTVTATGSVIVRDIGDDGTPENPTDGLGDIVHTAQATVSPATKAITVKKKGYNCDVGQPVCANNLPGTSFKVFSTDPGVGSPTGTSLANSPSGSSTFVTGQLVVNNDYWLVETSAPEGYQLLAQPIKLNLTANGVTLDPSSASSLITVDSGFTVTVTDAPAGNLPKAGGTGFLPYLAAGFLLIAGACWSYVSSCRKARTTRRRA